MEICLPVVTCQKVKNAVPVLVKILHNSACVIVRHDASPLENAAHLAKRSIPEFSNGLLEGKRNRYAGDVTYRTTGDLMGLSYPCVLRLQPRKKLPMLHRSQTPSMESSPSHD